MLFTFSGAGSTYDLYARLLARHLGNHIPDKPTFIVQNMQGAGGLKVVDYLNKIAPKDGAGDVETSGALKVTAAKGKLTEVRVEDTK